MLKDKSEKGAKDQHNKNYIKLYSVKQLSCDHFVIASSVTCPKKLLII